MRTNKDCENRYKICRKNSGLTQEQATEFLHISTRRLSDYENGEIPPDDIVEIMAEIYKAPMLAWWHLKQHNKLGKFLPEIIIPQTNGDIAFLAILAHDELSTAILGIKKSMPNLSLEEENQEEFRECIRLIRSANSKLFSVVAYAEQIDKEIEQTKQG